jgi:hypothetical protein
MKLLFDMEPQWVRRKDGNVEALRVFKRHYSYKHSTRREDTSNASRNQFVGPGEHIVLTLPDYSALFVWRKFIDDSGQSGVNCAVFRNESERLSSELILEAEQIAQERWAGERLYTYVNHRKVESNNPGYCFLCAGWKRCGYTKSGLLILEKP